MAVQNGKRPTPAAANREPQTCKPDQLLSLDTELPKNRQDNPTLFGPWVPGIGADERKAQFRSITALAAAFCGSGSPVVAAMRAAEHDEAAAADALLALNSLPALTRRRLLSVFGAATWPPKHRRSGR
jgi:hypothetical protein